MSIINCYDFNGVAIRCLTQWDHDVSVHITGVNTDPVPEFRFSNKKSKKAICIGGIVTGDGLKSVIPNELLREAVPVYAQLFYKYPSGDAKTEYTFVIPVKPACMPDGEVYEPSEVKSFAETVARLERLEKNIPKVPDWALQSSKPAYTASEVGADPKGTAESAVSDHDTNLYAHGGLRRTVQSLTERINAALDSDDTTLDQLSEIVAYIKSNKSLIDAITTAKVSVADIVNDTTTDDSSRPLSAAMGMELRRITRELEQAAEETEQKLDALANGLQGGTGGNCSGHYVVSDTSPEDTSALWIDTSNPGEAVALGATVVETEDGVAIYATDELGTTMTTVRHGRDGVTPAKGVDYFTPNEVQEIAEIAANIVKDAGDEWEALTVTDVARLLISPKGGLLNSSEDKLVSEPISIRGGDALRVTGSAKYGNSLWAIYNSAGEMIANQVAPATAAGLTVAEQEIEAPNGAASIRVAWDKTISDIPYAVSRKAAEQTAAVLPLDGVTVAVLGDSIVQGQGVANDLCTRLAAATGANVVNLGVGGTGWMHRQEEGSAYYQRIADIPENADIVILSGGGNDRNDPLGTADSTGTDTVAGCIHATLDAVRARVPAARVCVAAPTPWQYYPPHNRGNDIAKLVDVMAEICRRRGIPFLDLYHTSGLAPWDDTIRALLFVDGDGVHPNDLGYGVFAPQFVQLALGGSHNPVDVQGVAEAVLAALPKWTGGAY